LIIGEDVGKTGGVFRATDGLYERYPKRVIDTPLSEGVIAGSAIGLAIAGWVPVAEIQFLGFAHNGFNQVVDQLARVRYRSGGRFSAQVTIRAPYGAGVRAPELHSDAFEAHFTHAPGLKVVAPSTPHDVKGLLLASIRDPDPVLFLEPLRGYRQVRGDVPEGDYTVEIGKARIARQGTDVTVVAWSAAVQVALQAAEDAQAQGVSVEVIDLRTLVPLDVATLAESVTRTGRAVVVQEAPLTSGFGAEVVATIQEEAFFSLQAPIRRVAAPDVPYPVQLLEESYAPNAERVLEAILSVTRDYSGPPPRSLAPSRPSRPGACGAEASVRGPGACSSRIFGCAPRRATPSLAPAADAANAAAHLEAGPLVARYEFKLPDIGEGLAEAEVARWLVKVGDRVVEDQPVLEMMTDKAAVEIPAPGAGVVVEQRVGEGDVVKIGAVLYVLDSDAAIGGMTVAAALPTETTEPRPGPPPQAGEGTAVLAPPAVRKLARDLGVDLARVKGSGPGGRISAEDVQRSAAAPAPAAAPALAGDRAPLRGVRRRMAETMAASAKSIAHVTGFHELDAGEFVALFRRLRDEHTARGRRFPFDALLVRATALAV